MLFLYEIQLCRTARDAHEKREREDMVTLGVQFATLADGTSYTAATNLDDFKAQ